MLNALGAWLEIMTLRGADPGLLTLACPTRVR